MLKPQSLSASSEATPMSRPLQDVDKNVSYRQKQPPGRALAQPAEQTTAT